MSAPRKMWIGGDWVASRSQKTREVIDPKDQKVIALVTEADTDDVKAAVGAARTAFDSGPWSTMMARDRGTLLFRIAQAIRDRAGELAELDSRNMGKPIVESEFDIADAAACFEYYAGWASKIHGETLSVPDNALVHGGARAGRSRGADHPVELSAADGGVEAGAGPRCGLYDGAKARGTDPAVCLILGEILAKAELAAGRRQHRYRRRPGGGRRARRDPRVDKIAFTGGVETGRADDQKRRRHDQANVHRAWRQEPQHRLRRCRLRRGGRWRAVWRIRQPGRGLLGRLAPAGRKERSTRRCWRRWSKKYRRIVLGDPLDRKTKMGPLVTARAPR